MIVDDVGVVAIGRNEGGRLLRCLRSVRSESRNIIYVDSGSTDGSTEAAKEIGAHVIELDLSRPFSAGRARNEGFAALRALYPTTRFVQFIDGDCTLMPGWLEAARAFIDQRREIAVVCGRRRELHPDASIYNRLCDIEWDTPVGETISCGGDALVRVEAFEAVGGFRTQLIAGEEPELCLRLRKFGWHIWRLDANMTEHDAAMTRIGQYWIRAVRGGYAYAEVSRLHQKSPYGIWRREMVRTVLWGGILPLFVCLGAVINRAALVFALVYPFQVIRISWARGPRSPQNWKYAVLITVAKFAEFQGVAKFYWRQLTGQSAELIEYK
jgi:glycosyltransferase involved in cell wall biosynthesis